MRKLGEERQKSIGAIFSLFSVFHLTPVFSHSGRCFRTKGEIVSSQVLWKPFVSNHSNELGCTGAVV